MTRLQNLLPDKMDEFQKAVYDVLMSRPDYAGLPKNSPLPGPFNAMIRSPQMVRLFGPLARYVRDEGVLEAHLAELAVITVGRIWSSEYEFASHAPRAVKAGIDAEIVDAIRNCRAPQFEQADEQAVFEYVQELSTYYQVSTQTYDNIVKHLGEQGTVELIGLTAMYTLVCMILNTFKVPLRDGMKEQFS